MECHCEEEGERTITEWVDDGDTGYPQEVCIHCGASVKEQVY